jgi:hypothetical protein
VTTRISEKPRILQPVTYVLGEGRHLLVFQTRDIGTGMDQVLITNDLSITTSTLQSYPVYTQDKPTMDDAKIKQIIHNEIKPIYELPNVSDTGEQAKCLAIWSIVKTEIDPLTKPDEDAFLVQMKLDCPTCDFQIIENSCRGG